MDNHKAMRKIIFSGSCHRVILQPRNSPWNPGEVDNHVKIQVEVEDDGNWFESDLGFSSSWLPELITLFDTAHEYMKKNCEPDIHNGVQYGWKFKQ